MIPANLQEHLKRLTGTSDCRVKSVGGGSINQTVCIDTNGQKFFCKLNSALQFPQMFEKEKSGLETIAHQNIIRVPGVIDCITSGTEQLLVLEWINTGFKSSQFWRRFGEQLAKMHYTSSEFFGFEEDNYMGSVVQINQKEKDWIKFFVRHRLQALVDACLTKGLLHARHPQQFEKIYQRLPQIFNIEKPSLLHGDLWSGNYMCDEASNPVLVDTAVYFGHRSIDIGMTTLFGGFDKEFYESYHYHYPFPNNYREQWEVCNLYPLLIHLLLFGKSYLSQIETTLKSYQ